MQPINVKRSINPNKIDINWLLRGNVVDVLIYWSKSKNLMMKTASNPIIRHFCSIICIEHKLNHFSPRSRSKLNGSLEMSVPVYPKYINHTDQQEIAKLWILILFWRFSVRPESAEKEYKQQVGHFIQSKQQINRSESILQIDVVSSINIETYCI